MVRLIPGPVARCVPIGAQHATNGSLAQQGTQQDAQQEDTRPYETKGVDAQQVTQHSRNGRATTRLVFGGQKLRVSEASNDTPADYWRIEYPNGATMDVLIVPPSTPADVAEIYRGARIEPLPGGSPREEAGAPVDPGVERRRDRVLAILAEQPDRRTAVVAEEGNPCHIAIAIRGVAVGELEISAERYDAFVLLALMNEYGHA